ncbi:MAG TPA: sigma-54 dependent transcriptional regulator [Thermoanaerobaculia bacterium]|nr:sigma-54 dependent transcriptional regulator [Thermoanaerobaculia bacterium]
MTPYSVLLVEDEPAVRKAVARFLERKGYETRQAGFCAEGLEAFRADRPDAVLLDYSLPDGDGLQLLRQLREIDPTVPVLVLTAHASIDLAVRAIKEGAEQFFTKPVELPAVEVVLARLMEKARDRQARIAGRSRDQRTAFDPFLGESPAIRALEARARRVLAAASPVLLRGETGTGKGVLAAWLHRHGPREAEPFVDLNCAGLASEFLETELFGHERGAFTGAAVAKQGLLEVAHRGTLFLDEIGDMPAEVQAKLLKVLEEQRFRRVGAIRDRQVDVRLIAASHHDLERLTAEERFRSDLYYRVSTLPLFVPPLRERGRDVVLLARAILVRIAADLAHSPLTLSAGAERALCAHPWPGNVRELRNVLERAVLFADGSVLEAQDLFPVAAPAAPPTLRTLAEAEAQHIGDVLREAGGNVERAAEILGLSRSSLYERLRKLGLAARAHRSGA